MYSVLQKTMWLGTSRPTGGLTLSPARTDEESRPVRLTLTVSKLKSEHTYALVTSRGSHWDKNAPQLPCPRAGSAWVSKAISHRRKTSKS
ncbi:unnamed protein product [Prunus brigantina]